MPRIPFLDFLKGVLIFLVVSGHFLQYAVYHGNGYWDDPFFKWLYMFHMPLFMAVAGYLSQPGLDRVSASRAIRSRFKAYVLPIIAWSTLYCLTVDLLGHPVSRETLVTLPGYLFHQIVGDLWFLWALFGAVVVTALAGLSGRYFAIVYLLSLGAVLSLPEYGNVILFKYTYPFFQIGYALARWGIPGIFLTKRPAVFVAALIPAVISYLPIHRATYVYNSGMLVSGRNAPNLLLRYSGALSMSLVAVYALYLLHGRLSGKTKAVFDAFGRDSIYIYIIQNYVYMVVDRLGGRIHLPKPDLATGWIISLVAGLLICTACYLAGSVLARNKFIAITFFGKSRKKAISARTEAEISLG